MYFQFLIEDQSTEILIKQVMTKLKASYPTAEILYNTKSFHGIGHLDKNGTPHQQKAGKLLNDLPAIMRGMGKALETMGNAAIIVVLDNDDNNTEELRKSLEQIVASNMILIDHEFCIAIEEMEAWLLGDINAIEKAYPAIRKNALREYVQDSICGTWEVLANAIYPGGLARLKKRASSYNQIGKEKSIWAERIGECLNIFENASPSFQFFIQSLIKRIEVA